MAGLHWPPLPVGFGQQQKRAFHRCGSRLEAPDNPQPTRDRIDRGGHLVRKSFTHFLGAPSKISSPERLKKLPVHALTHHEPSTSAQICVAQPSCRPLPKLSHGEAQTLPPLSPQKIWQSRPAAEQIVFRRASHRCPVPDPDTKRCIRWSSDSWESGEPHFGNLLMAV
ncbi:MAG: hypothetical protein CM15mP39_07160 [Synechococcus sp.]|nr:MAG: hypothetical protein CM15mP39_07160 [Synechococcus sp.]